LRRPEAESPATPELRLIRGAGPELRRGPYRVHLIERPGETLPRASHPELMAMVRREALAMFDDPTVGDYWDHRPHYLDDLSEWWVAELGGRLAGWSAATIWDAPWGPVAYMDTLGIHPAHRRSGLGAILGWDPLLRVSRRRRRVGTLTLRTESPIIFRLCCRVGGRWVYPHITPEGDPIVSEKALAAVEFTAERLNPPKPVEPETMIMRGALDFVGSLYGSQPPPCGDDAIDRFFRKHVDLAGGDSVAMAFVPEAAMLLRSTGAYASILGQLVLNSRRRRGREKGRDGSEPASNAGGNSDAK